ncbi:MAG: hypothetical protein KF836_12180 [Fimbriimonadaceae bacterium]|nr:hypothetical protein [Fimbriimonadaceae bacterium]
MIAAVHLLYVAKATQFLPCEADSLLLNASTMVQIKGNQLTCFSLRGELIATENLKQDNLQLARIAGQVFVYQQDSDFVRQVELADRQLKLLEEKPVTVKAKDLLTLEKLSSRSNLEFESKDPFLKSITSRHLIDFHTSDKVDIVNVCEVLYESGTRYVARMIYRLDPGKAVAMTRGLKRSSIALFVDDGHIVGATSDQNDSNLPLMSESDGTFPDWTPFVMDARSGGVQLFPPKKRGNQMTAMLPLAVNPGRTKILAKKYVMQPNYNRTEELVSLDQSGETPIENIQFAGESYKPVRVIDAINSTVIVLAATPRGQEQAFVFRFE